MKTIKTTIATTLPDAVKAKFTKEALSGMRDQINKGEFFVTDVNREIKIGSVKKAAISEKDLVVKMKLDDTLIDKSFEWFFVPFGIPIDISLEGEFEVIRQVDLVCIQMVKMPTDLSLKPVRFEMEFVEGVDYFVVKHNELTPELVAEFIEKGNQVAVYYPDSMEWADVIKDTLERGLVVDTGGEPNFVHPFSVSVIPETFEEFKKQIALSWQNFSSEKKMDPLLKNIG
ncbi:hypothetical protein KAR91_78960 [Candidatus Pacearchaeota archaeon]|nr:hypothetical protein [Candidatus Pacearchaeota archaeon]